MTAPLGHWCRRCRVHRTQSVGALCPVCDETSPDTTAPPRMDHDPIPHISTTAGEA
jgi:hypothetical protein